MKTFWFTGNSGAGKSTVVFALQEELRKTTDLQVVVLDGDQMRDSISESAGFSAEERKNHNLRVARLAKVLQEQGCIVLVSVIAPFKSVRKEIEALCAPCWIYIKRDGLTNQERPYEEPDAPALILDHNTINAEQSLRLAYEFIIQCTD